MKTIAKFAMTAVVLCLSATTAHANHDGHMKCHPSKKHCRQAADASYHLTQTDVSRLQRSLTDKGFYRGPVDGLWGMKTTQAIQAYQTANDLQASGTLSTTDLANLGVRIDESAYDNGIVYNDMKYDRHDKKYWHNKKPNMQQNMQNDAE